MRLLYFAPCSNPAPLLCGVSSINTDTVIVPAGTPAQTTRPRARKAHSCRGMTECVTGRWPSLDARPRNVRAAAAPSPQPRPTGTPAQTTAAPRKETVVFEVAGRGCCPEVQQSLLRGGVAARRCINLSSGAGLLSEVQQPLLSALLDPPKSRIELQADVSEFMTTCTGVRNLTLLLKALQFSLILRRNDMHTHRV